MSRVTMTARHWERLRAWAKVCSNERASHRDAANVATAASEKRRSSPPRPLSQAHQQ